MTEKYKIVDAKGKHLFNKKVFNSFIDTYNFIDSLKFEDLEDVEGMELFVIPIEKKTNTLNNAYHF